MAWATGEAAIPTPEVTNEERDRLLLAWEAAKTALTAAKNAEMEARKAAAAYLVPKPREGTNTVQLGNGYEAKLVHTVNYKFTETSEVQEALAKIAAMPFPEAADWAARVINWTPTLRTAVYHELDTCPANSPGWEAKQIFDTVLITSDGAPALEIKAPKEKR